jgi:hypothetical protein
MLMELIERINQLREKEKRLGYSSGGKAEPIKECLHGKSFQ